jgi:Protein of unknown function (DUF3866)
MATFARGTVTEILSRNSDIVHLRARVGDDEVNAAAFPDMLGPLDEGAEVILNMTGIALGLGTGGTAFVLWNLNEGVPEQTDGHIMKLRYTPWQKNVLSVESPESPHHQTLAGVESIDGTPVIACGLHSQLAPAAAGVKSAAPLARVGYLMTDGGALPLAWSRLVKDLKDAGLVDDTATCGHAFGGEFEAVNVFSGLAALHHVPKCDVIIVAMGPGVVGTSTTLGNSALEQGQVLDAATALAGRAIACLRISFADERERHRGVSHHSLSALRLSARERCTVVVPELPQHQKEIAEQLNAAGIDKKHAVEVVDGSGGIDLLKEKGLHPTSMGRGIEDTPELFLAAAAAGSYAGALVAPVTGGDTAGR